MRLPFVSRERYEEARGRIATLEAETQMLLDRVLLLSGQRPIFGEVPQAVALPPPDLSNVQPIAGKPTLASIKALANRTAAQKAKNNESIVQELHEVEMRAIENLRKPQKHG